MEITFVVAAILIEVYQLDSSSSDMKSRPAVFVTLFLFCIFIASYDTTCG